MKVEVLPTVIYFVSDGGNVLRPTDLPTIDIGPVYFEGPTFSVESFEIIYELSIVQGIVNARDDLGETKGAGVA